MSAQTPWTVQSHRAPRTGAEAAVARLGSRVGVAGLVIAALALSSVVTAYEYDADRQERPFASAGATGEDVPGRLFDARVVSVRGAAKIGTGRGNNDTAGVWVLVRVRATAKTEPTTVTYATLTAEDGRVYHDTGRISQPLVGVRGLQPGLPVVGEIIFELPRSAALGELTLSLSPNSIDQRMDTMIEIRLPRNDAATVERWATSTEVTQIAETGLATE